MSTNKQAQAIISDIRLKHGSGDEYAPIIRWDEFQVISNALEAAESRIAALGGHLKSAHAFIENTEAFGHEAASGILKCGDSEWNVDASKESLAAAGIGVKGE